MTPEPVARPLVGFRAWRVTDGDDPVLAPLLDSLPAVAGDAWARPQERVRAHCVRTGAAGLCADAVDCDCGLHAHSRWHWMTGEFVTGAIVAWGRIVQHRLGFRAEYARPLAFAEPTHDSTCCSTSVAALYSVRMGCDCSADSDLPARMAERYEVPLLPAAELIAYASWFGDFAVAQGPRAVVP